MFIKESQALDAASLTTSNQPILRKARAATRLREGVLQTRPAQRFAVFLSHSRLDADYVYGIKALLENAGLSVYVDWIDDAQLDRTYVTPETAATIRARIKQSSSLIYLHSPHSSDSKWMPWELGYADSALNKVAILPIVRTYDAEFNEREYLGLYPKIRAGKLNANRLQLNVSQPQMPLRQWALGGAPQLWEVL